MTADFVSKGTLLNSIQLDASVANVLTNPVSLAQKVDVLHGDILWQLLDYAWLPQGKTSSELRASLADLHPDAAGGTSDTPDKMSTGNNPSPATPFITDNNLPATYARMLGDDMLVPSPAVSYLSM